MLWCVACCAVFLSYFVNPTMQHNLCRYIGYKPIVVYDTTQINTIHPAAPV